MTREEAERILRSVACRCDGRGVVPGPEGVAVSCPDCDGGFVSSDALKEARDVLGGLSSDMLARRAESERAMTACIGQAIVLASGGHFYDAAEHLHRAAAQAEMAQECRPPKEYR